MGQGRHHMLSAEGEMRRKTVSVLQNVPWRMAGLLHGFQFPESPKLSKTIRSVTRLVGSFRAMRPNAQQPLAKLQGGVILRSQDGVWKQLSSSTEVSGDETLVTRVRKEGHPHDTL